MRKKRKALQLRFDQSSFSVKTILTIIVIAAVITLIFNQGIIPTPAPSLGVEEPAIEKADLFRFILIGIGVIIAGLIVFWRELSSLMRRHLKFKTVVRKLFWK